MYGITGWTERGGANRILEGYWRSHGRKSGVGEELDSYRRFGAVSGQDLAALRASLPQANLADRQNGAPTCGDLLMLAAKYPGQIGLSGYRIGQCRDDERITFDGTTVVDDVITDPAHSQGAWQWLKEQLNDARVDPPDELTHFVEAQGEKGWFFWWD